MAGRCTCSNWSLMWSLMMLQGWTDCLQCGNRILMGFGGVSQCSWLFLTILNRSAFLEASNSHRGALPLNSPGLIACRLLVNQFGYCIRTCLCSVFATKSSRANGDVRNIAQSWHRHTHTADIRRYMMVQAWHSMSEFSCTAEDSSRGPGHLGSQGVVPACFGRTSFTDLCKPRHCVLLCYLSVKNHGNEGNTDGHGNFWTLVHLFFHLCKDLISTFLGHAMTAS